MPYVVQKADEEPKRAYHSGSGDIYDAQICTYPISYVVQKAREWPTSEIRCGFAGCETRVC